MSQQIIKPDIKQHREFVKQLQVAGYKQSVDEKELLRAELAELKAENKRLAQLLKDSQELIDSLQAKKG